MEIMPVKYEECFGSNFPFDESGDEGMMSRNRDLSLINSDWPELDLPSPQSFVSTYFDDLMKELVIDNSFDSLFGHFGIDPLPLDDFWADVKEEDCSDVVLRDCMWAGQCASNEHPVEDSKDKLDTKFPSTLTTAGSMELISPVATKSITNQAPPQQSLLKPSLWNAGVPVINMITPHTPPMSDDDEKQKIKQTQVLRLYSSGGEDNESEQELRDYLGIKKEENSDDSDEEDSSSSSSSSSEDEDDYEQEKPAPSISYPSTSQVTSIRSNVYATENDHSYHKGKNGSMRNNHFGVETPSDSDAEIDVVSIPDKKCNGSNRMSYVLPTNPSYSDRRNLQKSMESAMITSRRTNNNNGLKIILPIKRSASSTPSGPPAKRRAASVNENKGNRKAKSYRMTNPTPYRRRTNYGHDSESEPEPSEKRSLHNNMERQRRIDLRNAFEYLRQLVPEVLKKERAAKVVILREAAKYCDSLTYNSMSMNKQLEDLKHYQERLRMKVSMLRRNLALKR